MAFQNDVVAGTTLVRPAIRSANYVPGVSGWTINRDGSAEFASGTFRGPVVVVDPNTGQVLASVGASGVGSFQSVSVANDVIIGTLSVKQELTNRPKGIVGIFSSFGSPFIFPQAPANGVFADICWCSFYNDPTRLYRVQIAPMYAVNGNVSNNQDLLIQLIANQQGGLPNGLQNFKIFDSRSSSAGGRAAPVCGETVFGGFGAPGTCTIQMRAGATDTNPFNFNNFGIFTLTVEDIGPFSGSVFVGGLGTAAGSAQYTVNYNCTASRSYDSNGNPNGAADQDQNVYQSSFPDRPYGNERSYMIFNTPRMRADMSGATIQSAQLFLYCIKAEEANGSFAGTTSGLSAVPATYDGSFIGTNFSADDIWPVPGWNSIDLLNNNVLASILSGATNSFALVTVFAGLAATGFGGSSPNNLAIRAYIQVTYRNSFPPQSDPVSIPTRSRLVAAPQFPLSTRQSQNRIR